MDRPDSKKLKLRELKRTDWPAISQLFGTKGACGGCWCMFWRLERGGKLWEENKGEPNRRAFKKLLEAGQVRGVLAFDRAVPVAWCSFGRRIEFPRTERMKAYAKNNREDTDQVWSINCFYIANGYRGIGLAERLVEKAVKGIKRRKGKLIEAYPVTLTKAGEKLPPAFSHTGPEIVFERQGFQLIQSLSQSRPLYQLSL